MPAPNNKIFEALHNFSLIAKSAKNENEKIVRVNLREVIFTPLDKQAAGPLDTVTSIKKDENNDSAKEFIKSLQHTILNVVNPTAAAKLTKESLNAQLKEESKEKKETPSMPSTPGMG